MISSSEVTCTKCKSMDGPLLACQNPERGTRCEGIRDGKEIEPERKETMNTFELKREPAELDPEVILVSAYSTKDGGYIGDEDFAKLLEEKGIQPETIPGNKVCSIGFCEREQKWYGWSHRAMYGFGVGSEVEQGDCAYVPTDMEDARKDAIRFWDDECKIDIKAETGEDEDGKPCFHISWTYDHSIPNEKMRGQIRSNISYPPETFGQGEWSAKTLDDAKQMAIDFARGVS